MAKHWDSFLSHCKYLDLDICFTKIVLTKSIQTASSNFTNLGINHSHIPLDFSLLPYWRRTTCQIWSNNLGTSDGRDTQYFCCQNHILTMGEHLVPTLDWRSENCTWVFMAQSILPLYLPSPLVVVPQRTCHHHIQLTTMNTLAISLNNRRNTILTTRTWWRWPME